MSNLTYLKNLQGKKKKRNPFLLNQWLKTEMTEGIERERVEGAFPIRETNGDTKIKNIIPSALPHFHGLTTEDPDTFLFEFVVIC